MAKRKSPAAVRMDLAKARHQGVGSALDHMQSRLANPEDEGPFLEWRSHPMTLLMLDAMREIAVAPPAAYLDTGDIGVQYGVSSALSFAASFFADPRVMFPQLFSGVTPDKPRQLPDADYSVDADGTTGRL